MAATRIIGIDPGLFTFAVAAVRFEDDEVHALAHGILEAQLSPAERARLRAHGERSVPAWVVGELMQRLVPWYLSFLVAHEPQIVVVESCRFQHSVGSTNMAQTAELRGLVHWLTRAHVPAPRWEEVTAPQVKKALTGKARGGDKKGVQQVVADRLMLPELVLAKNSHLADAYGCALAWQQRASEPGEKLHGSRQRRGKGIERSRKGTRAQQIDEETPGHVVKDEIHIEHGVKKRELAVAGGADGPLLLEHLEKTDVAAVGTPRAGEQGVLP